MCEDEWLTCVDPREMLRSLGDRISDRKLRLFQVACCRRIWDLMPDDLCREAVLVAEQYADGDIGDRKRRAIRREIGENPVADDLAQLNAGYAAFHANEKTLARKVIFLGVATVMGHAARTRAVTQRQDPFRAAFYAEERTEIDLIRCLTGNPFRRVDVEPPWRSATVVPLAEGIYEDRAFDRMPILADALQDSGCDNADILDHCYGPGPHARGCWVVDLILGKE